MRKPLLTPEIRLSFLDFHDRQIVHIVTFLSHFEQQGASFPGNINIPRSVRPAVSSREVIGNDSNNPGKIKFHKVSTHSMKCRLGALHVIVTRLVEFLCWLGSVINH